MPNKAMSPNHREAITAVSSITGNDEYLLSTNGALNTTGGGGGGATVVGIGPVGFNSSPYDSLTYTNTSGTIDTYQYYAGGTGGTLKATVTITWTDSTKTVISSVVRT